MKLKNFLLIAGVVAAAGIGGATWMCSSDDKEVASEEPTRANTAEPAMADPEDELANDPGPDPDTKQALVDHARGVNDPKATAPSGLRDVDTELMSWIGKDLGSKKVKDAAKGHRWKINVYQDAGKSTMNRAKIDLDRDDQWDEKWTFDGKNISRKVAPADDENYSEEYDWNGREWTAR